MEQEQTDFRPNTLDDVLTEDTSAAPTSAADPDAQPPHEAAQHSPRQANGALPDGDAAPGAFTGEDFHDAPPASETSDGADGFEPTVPLAALQDERRKRQELAERLSSMEQQAAAAARPDPFEDPAGAAEFDRRENEASSFRLRCDMSQEMMRQAHPDYDEVESLFVEAAEINPALAVQLANHPFPARFAYQQGSHLRDLLMAEAPQRQTALPESLAEAPSASPRQAAQWSGPKPLKQILG